MIACVDGLKGLPDALNSAFPDAKVQLCNIHMVRNSLKFIVWKNYKAVTAGLKKVYRSSTEEVARTELEHCAQKWDDKYTQTSKSW